MTETLSTDRLLRTALRANAGFSGLCGITALLAAGSLASALGIQEKSILPVQGVSLVFFSGLLVWLATRRTIKPALALAIVVMDLLWVLTTAAPLLLSGWLTALGTEVMIVLASIVLSFAALQYLGIRRMKTVRTA
jgi:hypothetical protein